MGLGPTSGHWPRATAGGPSSWREKGQVTRSEPSPAQLPWRGRKIARGAEVGQGIEGDPGRDLARGLN